MRKKKIGRFDKIKIRLREFDRDLILDNTFIEPEYVKLFESSNLQSGYITIAITLYDLDFILGHIAASANHEEDPKLKAALDKVYDYLAEIEFGYVLIDY